MIPTRSILVNEKISLHPPVPEDAAAIFRTIDEHRESLRTWLPFVDFTKTQQDSENFLGSVVNSEEILFIIRFEDMFAGLIGLKNPDHMNHKVEIGYWLNPLFEGKGIVTLSCYQLIQYAFRKLNMNRILIQVATGNQKSRRIPERLGFQEEGIERDGELLVSGYTDIVKYGLLKREFYGNN